jgi:hypothetical protein
MGGYVDPDPLKAQKEAGNYRRHLVRVHGLDVTIENPKNNLQSNSRRLVQRAQNQKRIAQIGGTSSPLPPFGFLHKAVDRQMRPVHPAPKIADFSVIRTQLSFAQTHDNRTRHAGTG